MSICRIFQGTVFDMLPTIERGSIDCSVTSPPYWMLRSYLPKGHALKSLELGQEPTPQEYVANVVRWCGLVRDCLADHGTLWLNVGDTYATSGGVGPGTNNKGNDRGGYGRSKSGIVPAGNLCLIPQRLMIALQEDGWLVRSIVIWHKPAPMPTSVTGWMWKRCRVKTKDSPRAPEGHKATGTIGQPQSSGLCRAGREGRIPVGSEWSDCPGCKKCQANGGYVLRRGSWRPTSAWEPIIMLAKTSNYFCDGEAVKQPPASSTVERDKYTRVIDDPDEQFAVAHDHETVCNGANLRDVWTIAAEPLREKHYAAYPSELVYRCLRAGTSQEGYCDQCGGPFVRVVEQGDVVTTAGSNHGKLSEATDAYGPLAESKCKALEQRAHITTGWRPSCRCPDAKPRPGRVLDPFCGSGRTGKVATRLGLDFTGVELNPEFVEMGKRIITQDSPLFNEFLEA